MEVYLDSNPLQPYIEKKRSPELNASLHRAMKFLSSVSSHNLLYPISPMTPDAEQNEKVKASISCGEVEVDENVTAHSIRSIATKKMVPIKKYLPKSVTMQHIGSQVSFAKLGGSIFGCQCCCLVEWTLPTWSNAGVLTGFLRLQWKF